MSDTAVGARALPAHETSFLGPRDELGDRALSEVEALRQLGDCRVLAAVGSPLDLKQEEVPARRQARRAGDAVGLPFEPSQGGAELGNPEDFLRTRRAWLG